MQVGVRCYEDFKVIDSGSACDNRSFSITLIVTPRMVSNYVDTSSLRAHPFQVVTRCNNS